MTGSELIERLDSPYSGGVSLRIKVWGGLAAATALLTAVVIYGISTAPTATSPSNASALGQRPIVYGWQHVPPHGSGHIDPSRIRNTIDGQTVICTAREPDSQGRWVCVTYTIVNEGQRMFVMPTNSPLRAVACNEHPTVPCPGTTI